MCISTSCLFRFVRGVLLNQVLLAQGPFASSLSSVPRGAGVLCLLGASGPRLATHLSCYKV
jgi:hypothetical protein